jgi:hypothetical protein
LKLYNINHRLIPKLSTVNGKAGFYDFVGLPLWIGRRAPRLRRSGLHRLRYLAGRAPAGGDDRSGLGMRIDNCGRRLRRARPHGRRHVRREDVCLHYARDETLADPMTLCQH